MNGLEGLKALSLGAKESLNQHLKFLVSQLSKGLNNKKLRLQIMEALAEIERNCGAEAYKLIKAKIPTYCSVL